VVLIDPPFSIGRQGKGNDFQSVCVSSGKPAPQSAWDSRRN